MAHVLHQQQVTQMLDQVGHESSEVLSPLRQLLDEEQSTGCVAVDDHVA